MNDMKTMNIKSTDYRLQITDYRLQITESGSVPGFVLAAIRKASVLRTLYAVLSPVLCTLCSVLLISSCTHDEITPPVNTTNDALALLPGNTPVEISAEVGEVTSRSSELTSITTGTYTMTLPRGASATVIRKSSINVEGVNTTNFPLYLKDFNLVEGNNRCVTRWALLEGDNVTDYVLGWARLTHNNGQPTLDFGQLKHANSKITLIVNDGENSTVDFSSGNKASFALQGASTQAVVTATGEELTAYLGGIKKLADDPTDASGFSLKVVADADADNTGDFSVVDGKVEAIVRPTPTGGALADTDKLTITIADDYSGLTSSQTGGTYSLKLSDVKLSDVKLSDTKYLTALEPGKHYTLTVTLRHNTLVAATATIGAWSTASASTTLGGDGAKLPGYEYDAETNTYNVLEEAGIEDVLADMEANADRANATVMMNGAEWTIVDGTVTDLATVQAAISGKTHIIVTGETLAAYTGNYANTVLGEAIRKLDNGTTVSLMLPEATSIGENAFLGCTALASVSLPSAKTIEEYAFYYCTSLTSVSLPSATTIGTRAFANCTALTSVSLPSATRIGEFAFRVCISLMNVSLDATTTIGTSAFEDCTSLTSVSLPAATSIGNYAFNGCTALASVSAPKATSIGSSAFSSCDNLASVSLPEATTIGGNAFRDCEKLESASLDAAITIGDNAFSSCDNLASVSAPKATSIGESAFYECIALKSVSLPEATTIGGNAFRDCEKLESASLDAAITIGDNAFSSCDNLASVSSPKATTIGTSAFYDCTSLASVSVAKAKSIEASAFYNCTSLQNVSLPAAKLIGEEAFEECTSLQNVSLPSATTIGSRAFAYCDALTSLTFGVVIESVDKSAFSWYQTQWTLNCALTLGTGSTGDPEEGENKTWAGYKWKSITLK